MRGAAWCSQVPDDYARDQVLSSAALLRLAQTLEDDADVLHYLERGTKRELNLRHAVHYLRSAADPDYQLGIKILG